MALGAVQAGYRNSLCVYSAQNKMVSEHSYEEWLAELTTELELALESEGEDTFFDEDTEDTELTKSNSGLKKEWEELLEGTDAVDAILRQMLENGLGQRKEEQQEKEEKPSSDNLDNEFDWGCDSAVSEGKEKDNVEYSEKKGNSEFLQRNSGEGAEYWNPSNSGRRQGGVSHLLCLFCETECIRKKQWKITE